jgi:DNA polymerase I-like protein with 3'-5' exonuclease and polymerase domains
MRFDERGLFWADERVESGRRSVARVMPPIPDTKWVTPTYYPNLSAAEYLTIDVEAKDLELKEHGPGWARGKSHLVGVAVGAPGGHKWYFPIRHEVEPEYNLNPDNTLAWLRDTLGNPLQDKLGANLLYDVGTLRSERVDVKGRLVDVQFAEALLDERAEVNLDTLGLKYLGEGKRSNVLYDWCYRYYGGSKDDQRENIWRAPPRLVGPYAEGDVDLPARLIPKLYTELVAQGLFEIFQMECALIPLLVDMRMEGVSVDVAKAEAVRGELEAGIAEEGSKLKYLTGVAVDINSSASLAKAFDSLGVEYPRTEPSKSHPTGQPSFTKAWLEKQHNPVADAVCTIRKLTKLKTVFVESYILNSHVNGKVYCTFHPLREDENGTRSGRLSSSHPNLQNIPIRDDKWGPIMRSLFIPDLGHKRWRKYDYSQIEYRKLIHFAVGPGSDEARSHFNEHPDTDYHEWALGLVAPQAGWDISTKEGHKKWRRPVKNLNFGLIFGMGEEAMAAQLGLTLVEAKKLFAVYHKGVPFAKPTMAATSEEAQRLGFITTILGRRSRYDLWEYAGRTREGEPKPPPLPYELAIRTYSRVKRAYTFRALNRRLQGSAADTLKVAMLKCYTCGIFNVTGVPRLTVHDELDFSDPGGVDEAFREMKHVMETAIPLSIPIRADGEEGPNWGVLKDLET